MQREEYMSKNMSERLQEALRGDLTPKFLATKDAEGIPNVVPVVSIVPLDAGHLIFGNYLMWKTARNLEAAEAHEDKTHPARQVSAMVLEESLFGALIRGRYSGSQKAGPWVDQINSQRFLRYNAYTGIRNAGCVDVTQIEGPFDLSKLGVLAGNTLSMANRLRAGGLSRGKAILNPTVREKFTRISAVKVLSFVDRDGWPVAAPAMSLQPIADDVLIFTRASVPVSTADLSDGARVAVCVLTMEPVAFQVKGTYKQLDPFFGAILLDEAYHASVPLPGKRITSSR